MRIDVPILGRRQSGQLLEPPIKVGGIAIAELFGDPGQLPAAVANRSRSPFQPQPILKLFWGKSGLLQEKPPKIVLADPGIFGHCGDAPLRIIGL